ncbi:MAG TPA: hypothetical protein VK629_14720, partial [Steroidobacteraceae bacterium]|nr:hypothetical protein [Steroidobacteraceae bacterium]
FELALHHGRRTSFGEYMSNGSCVMFSVEAIADDGSADDTNWPTTKCVDCDLEELRLIGWGGSESVLSYRGRHYIATYGGWSHGIEYLEWLTPAATRRGLCTFEDTGSERMVAKRLDPGADCDALARAPAEDIAAPGSDLDNDGKSDPVVVGGEDSGAGCGRSWRNISFVDANGDVEASARNDELRKLIGLENGPVKLLTLKGKRYIYAKNGDVTAAYSVTKTAVIPQCEFRIQYKRRVKTQFSFDSDTQESP